MKIHILVAVLILAVFLSGCLRTSCPTTSDPVCGADGITYKNACLAKEAGVQVNKTGECQQQSSQCLDSDGGKDIFTAGIVTHKGQRYGDSCVDDKTVEERFCENNEAKSVNLPCAAGYACDGGKCVVIPCTDSDGGVNEEMKGTVVAGDENETDRCADSNTVKEFYCDSGRIASKDVDCAAGKQCSDAACILVPCEDSDGGKTRPRQGERPRGTNPSQTPATARRP